VSAPDHLATVVSNARALATRGDLHGAQALLAPALDPAVTMFGPDHPDVLAGTRLLASLHRDLGDLSHARRLLEEALAAGQFTLGEDSPTLLPLSYDLATLADELGNRHEARRNFTLLVRHGPAALGPDHEYVLAARRYLGGPGVPETGRSAATAAALSAPASAGPPPPTVQPAPPMQPPPSQPTPPVQRVPSQPTPSRQPAPPVPPPPPARPVPPLPPPPPPDRIAPSGPFTPDPLPPARVWPIHDSDEHRHSRAPILALVLVAAMALVGGVVAAFLVLRAPARGTHPGPQPSPTAKAEAPQPPGGLKLRDDGTSITVTWTDPTGGAVPFIVMGGRSDTAPNFVGSVESGKTSYPVHGLSPAANYCFLVLAVYSSQSTVPSELACTRRGSSPSPGR
jgi:hypothetical protein